MRALGKVVGFFVYDSPVGTPVRSSSLSLACCCLIASVPPDLAAIEMDDGISDSVTKSGRRLACL